MYSRMIYLQWIYVTAIGLIIDVFMTTRIEHLYVKLLWSSQMCGQ